MPDARRLLIPILLFAACGPLSGCAMMRNWFGPRDPFAQNAPCALPPDASNEMVVAHLNANISRVGAWRSDNVAIRGWGAAETPVRVDAKVAIEAPRRFRLTAGTLAGEEVDLGSNQDQFWFWNRRSEEKYVFVAYHDQESVAGRNFPIPFQPEWIMEVFGVMTIDPAETTCLPGQPGMPNQPNTIHLVANRTSPQGRPVRKITIIDTCHGVIREHALYDEQGQIVASARLSHHFREPRTQAVLPRQIDLHWPRANMGLTMWLDPRHVEVNPQHIPDGVWQRPTKDGYQVFDLNRSKPGG
jgi:hypothetical protein